MSGLGQRTGGNTGGAESPDTEELSGESKAGAGALGPELKLRGGWLLEKSTGSVCSLGPGSGPELVAE